MARCPIRLEELFKEARQRNRDLSPDLSRVEDGFEDRVMRRIRLSRAAMAAADEAGGFLGLAWRAMPAFCSAALVVSLGAMLLAGGGSAAPSATPSGYAAYVLYDSTLGRGLHE